MMVKVNPEVARILVAVTAFVQALGAGFTGAEVLPERALIVLVVVGGALQLALATYLQGVQTEPPHGMVTEEAARDAEAVAPKGTEPPLSAPQAAPYASGVARVPEAYDPG